MRSDLLLLEEKTGCSPTHRMVQEQVLWYILWLLLPALTVWMLRTIFSGCWPLMCLLCLGMGNMNKMPSADVFRRRSGFLWSGEGLTGTNKPQGSIALFQGLGRALISRQAANLPSKEIASWEYASPQSRTGISTSLMSCSEYTHLLYRSCKQLFQFCLSISCCFTICH